MSGDLQADKPRRRFAPHPGNNLEMLLLGSAVAFVVAILAIKFFINYVTKYGFAAFGWYRIIVGIVIIACALCGIELKMVD